MRVGGGEPCGGLGDCCHVHASWVCCDWYLADGFVVMGVHWCGGGWGWEGFLHADSGNDRVMVQKDTG